MTKTLTVRFSMADVNDDGNVIIDDVNVNEILITIFDGNNIPVNDEHEITLDFTNNQVIIKVKETFLGLRTAQILL